MQYVLAEADLSQITPIAEAVFRLVGVIYSIYRTSSGRSSLRP
jgi:hypothetical protein